MGTSGGPWGNVAASWLISGGRSEWVAEGPASVDMESCGFSSCSTAISTRELDLVAGATSAGTDSGCLVILASMFDMQGGRSHREARKTNEIYTTRSVPRGGVGYPIHNGEDLITCGQGSGQVTNGRYRKHLDDHSLFAKCHGYAT